MELIDKEEVLKIIDEAGDVGEAHGDINCNCNIILTIPNNPTNGDVIKAIFFNIESKLDEKTGIILVKWTDGTTKTFKASWWNTPYEVESKDKI